MEIGAVLFKRGVCFKLFKEVKTDFHFTLLGAQIIHSSINLHKLCLTVC